MAFASTLEALEVFLNFQGVYPVYTWNNQKCVLALCYACDLFMLFDQIHMDRFHNDITVSDRFLEVIYI
jgi:hypothetical protein